ncbi:MAG TPA: hypothetical protein VF212_17720 [Longimicrobiales bacterium]
MPKYALDAMRALCLAALLAAPAPALAQRAPNAEPVRPSRFLAVGSLARVESSTALSTGFLYQLAFRDARVERGPAGNLVQTNPRWYAHFLASAGAARVSGEYGFAGFAQLGVARRSDHSTFTALALAAQAIYAPVAFEREGHDAALGPVARVEIMDNLGVQAGWVFGEGESGVFLSLDYMRDILRDLGLAN